MIQRYGLLKHGQRIPNDEAEGPGIEIPDKLAAAFIELLSVDHLKILREVADKMRIDCCHNFVANIITSLARQYLGPPMHDLYAVL